MNALPAPEPPERRSEAMVPRRLLNAAVSNWISGEPFHEIGHGCSGCDEIHAWLRGAALPAEHAPPGYILVKNPASECCFAAGCWVTALAPEKFQRLTDFIDAGGLRGGVRDPSPPEPSSLYEIAEQVRKVGSLDNAVSYLRQALAAVRGSGVVPSAPSSEAFAALLQECPYISAESVPERRKEWYGLAAEWLLAHGATFGRGVDQGGVGEPNP